MNTLAVALARLCDQVASSIGRKRYGNTFATSSLHKALTSSYAAKGRLLHYFPREKSTAQLSAWCGAHCDHSVLTALCSAMFVDERSGLQVSPPQGTGLYIHKDNKNYKASIPADCIAIQLGESAEIITGGALSSTVHSVRPSEEPHISRSTFAVFFQPNPDYMLRLPTVVKNVRDKTDVPSLTSRFPPSPGQCTFGEFASKTVKAYVA